VNHRFFGYPRSPLIEEFITYDGKCAVCEHLLSRGRYCIKKNRIVAQNESCELFKQGGRKK